MKARFILCGALIGLLALPAIGAAKKNKDYDDPPPPDGYPQPLPPGQMKKQGGGPPPWAPAHGYRAKQQYRYYPKQNIYMDPATGMYFSFQGGAWAKGPLPYGLTPHTLGHGYMIMGDPDAPYNANGMHMKKYKKQ